MSVGFFGFRHFGRRFRGLFSYEFMSFFGTELFFKCECWFFWLQTFWKTVLWPFFIRIHKFFSNRLVFLMRVLVFLASGILEDGFCGLFSYEFISFF